MKISFKGECAFLPGAKMYEMNGCAILVELEPGGWHLSISHKNRYPSWEEIKRARYELLPKDRNFIMVLPPPSDYVNVHPNCFHLYEERCARCGHLAGATAVGR